METFLNNAQGKQIWDELSPNESCDDIIITSSNFSKDEEIMRTIEKYGFRKIEMAVNNTLRINVNLESKVRRLFTMDQLHGEDEFSTVESYPVEKDFEIISYNVKEILRGKKVILPTFPISIDSYTTTSLYFNSIQEHQTYLQKELLNKENEIVCELINKSCFYTGNIKIIKNDENFVINACNEIENELKSFGGVGGFIVNINDYIDLLEMIKKPNIINKQFLIHSNVLYKKSSLIMPSKNIASGYIYGIAKGKNITRMPIKKDITISIKNINNFRLQQNIGFAILEPKAIHCACI